LRNAKGGTIMRKLTVAAADVHLGAQDHLQHLKREGVM